MANSLHIDVTTLPPFTPPPTQRRGTGALTVVTLTVTIPEALARRVEAFARAQGRATDEVIVEALEHAVPIDPETEAAVKARFSFVAIGDGPDDLAERHKPIRRDHFAGRSVDES